MKKVLYFFAAIIVATSLVFFINPLTKAGDTVAAETEYTTISNEANAYLDRIISVTSTDDYEYIKKQLAMFEEVK